MKTIRNTIVVMFDSWQFNYTGCYGNDWIKTPNFDRFAKEAVLFENAYSNNLPTLPVRRSMMTGRFTLHEVGWGPLRQEDTTVADLLWGSGIDTALAYNSNVMFIMKGGYNRSYATAKYSHGFNTAYYLCDELKYYSIDQYLTDEGYVDRLTSLGDGQNVLKMVKDEMNGLIRHRQYWKTDDDHTVAVNIHNAIKMLEEADRNHSLHLWIDSWDPHEPWDPPSVWTEGMSCPYDPDYKGADMWVPPMIPVGDVLTEEQCKHIRALYAEKVTLCDKYFGQLMDAIHRLGYDDNTLIWLCSDHGEPLGRGEHGHGLMCKCRPWPYEELVHIPLMISFPGCKRGMRVKSFVQDCDCAPTLLEWMGVPIPENMTGKSLIPLCRGEVEKVRDFAIAGYFKFSWSIITEDWSFIHWLKKMDNQKTGLAEAYVQIYTYADNERAKKRFGADLVENVLSESAKAGRTLDGADQWTCTPGGRVDVPEGDELYDRHTDPFQLNNVIDEHRDVAEKLLKKLNLFMQDLSAE